METERTRKFTIIGLGEVLWDVFPSGKRLGGAPANFAYHAAALGARGLLVSCVGDDALGREIFAALYEKGLSREFVAIDPAHPTGVVSVTLDAEGKPSYRIEENAAWDFLPLSPSVANLAKSADAICFGTLAQRSSVSRQTIYELLDAAPSSCLKILDINLRQSYFCRETAIASLDRSDALKLNDEELPVLARLLGISGSTEIELLHALRKRYDLNLIALTRGEGGSLLMRDDETSVHKGFAVRVVDTVGAGDAFTAALALGVLKGEPLAIINEQANRLASYVCSQSGAMPKVEG